MRFLCLLYILLSSVISQAQLGSQAYLLMSEPYSQKSFIVSYKNIDFNGERIFANNRKFRDYHGSLERNRLSIYGGAKILALHSGNQVLVDGHHNYVITSAEKGRPNLTIGNAFNLDMTFNDSAVKARDVENLKSGILYKIVPVTAGILFKNKNDRYMIEQQTGLDLSKRMHFYIRGVLYIR